MKLTEEEYFSRRDDKFNDLLDKSGDCWLFTGSKSKGYGVFSSKRLGTNRAHQYAYVRANGEIPKGFWVLHKCDIRNCCNPNHLYAGTPTENTRDKLRRTPSHNQILNEDMVKEMRKDYNSGTSLIDLVIKYRVRECTILAAVTRKTWNYVED